MKNIQIILLIFIAAAIAVLASFMGDLTTYDTVASAKRKPGQFVHLIAKLDQTQKVEYDPIKNPNYLKFTAVDSLGNGIPVIYKNAKPENLEVSSRLVLKGAVKGEYFECKEILLKCPSKYKEEKNGGGKKL